MAKYRTEKDFLGEVRVPQDAYYGAETERAKENFPISGLKVPKHIPIALTIIKRSAALANMKEGKLDRKRGNAIVKACDEAMSGKFDDQFVVDVFQAGAGTSVNMNVNEVIANRSIEILGGKKGDYRLVHPNDHVNMSQSTNDVYHAAMHLAVYHALMDELMPSLSTLHKALESKSGQFSTIVKIGRTHLQDAVPITLGQEFSGYASSISRNTNHIRDTARYLLPLSLGGTAVGTGIETKRAYPRDVVAEINRFTGYKFKVAGNFFDIQQNQNEERWVSSSLSDLAVALNKIANDLRLLSSGPVAGFSDIILPAVQPGSSIMPGKINPSMAEMMNMVCFEVIGNNATVEHAAEGGQLELNVFMPIISHNLLYSIKILSNGIEAFTKKCVSGIRVNTDRINADMDRNISLATALAPYIGYDKASEIAKRARRENKTVKQVSLELKVLPKKELDRILDPKRQVRPSE